MTLKSLTMDKSAIEAASKTQPDLMVLDIGLPVMSGYEVRAPVAEHPKLKSRCWLH